MKTSEVLHLQALKMKREVLAMNPEIEHDDCTPLWQRDTYDTAGETRNICAMIPVSLFNEIERLSDVLRISKRAMVEMAIRDLAVNANKALDDVGFDAASIQATSAGHIPGGVE